MLSHHNQPPHLIDERAKQKVFNCLKWKQLEAEADRIRQEIEVQEKQTESVEQFIARLKDHSLEIDTLDGYILHELIEAIYVEAPDKSSGHRVQRIHIKYSGIGFIPINELIAKQTA